MCRADGFCFDRAGNSRRGVGRGAAQEGGLRVSYVEAGKLGRGVCALVGYFFFSSYWAGIVTFGVAFERTREVLLLFPFLLSRERGTAMRASLGLVRVGGGRVRYCFRCWQGRQARMWGVIVVLGDFQLYK